tara:strand:- start:3514 stop:3672 length:159 start_codon:yes stop_codon:yes gene_type:complete
MKFDLFLGDVEDRLDTINSNLEEIKQLLVLLLTPPDLKEYEEWKLKKRKGLD